MRGIAEEDGAMNRRMRWFVVRNDRFHFGVRFDCVFNFVKRRTEITLQRIE